MKKDLVLTSVLLLVAICIYACDGGGGGTVQSNVPAAATAMDADLKSSMAKFFPLVAPIDSSLIFVMNPGTSMISKVKGKAEVSRYLPGCLPVAFQFILPAF